MTNFGNQIKAWTERVEQGAKDVHTNATEKVHDSIRFGSRAGKGGKLTGAPGQPVDTGFLINSWHIERRGPFSARVYTNCAYAPVIEEGNRAAYDPTGETGPPGEEDKPRKRPWARSEVGGAHSVKLTTHGWTNIVAAAKREVLG